jgi:hypothetical protein
MRNKIFGLCVCGPAGWDLDHVSSSITFLFAWIMPLIDFKGFSLITSDKPVLGRTALALEEWLDSAGIMEGAILRRLWKRRLVMHSLAKLTFWVHDRSQPPRGAAPGDHVDDRAPIGIERDRIFPSWWCRSEARFTYSGGLAKPSHYGRGFDRADAY